MGKSPITHGAGGKGGTGAAAFEGQQVRVVSMTRQTLAQDLMQIVCSKSNLNRAYKRVKSNKGSPGVDGMSVDELGGYIRENKVRIVSSILDGAYKPNAVRGVEIPKAKGGTRQLGIPTVLDRLVQQAIYQVLEPIFEPKFSDSSYGFRPKRSAHQALKAASAYVASGKEWVVDIDLAKYFDQVNHDILMSRLVRVIGDIMLDELDKELERRGHTFCRYADDCNIYVGSEKAGQRVMQSTKQFLATKLKLQINETKSAVAMVGDRQFLGYRIRRNGQLSASPDSIKRMKDKVRELTKRKRGSSLKVIIQSLNRYLPGWFQYFRLQKGIKLFERTDQWIRRRLRCYRLKQRKQRWPIAKYLMSLGISKNNAWRLAMSDKGWWRKSQNPIINAALSNEWFNNMGLVSLLNKANQR